MDPNRRVSLQKLKNAFGLMCTQIIGNDVDLAASWLSANDLGEGIDKLRTGVPCAGFSKNLSGLGIEGGIERKGSVAIVLEAMPFGSPWREWQNRIQAIKCLDGTLFVNANTAACTGGLRYNPIMSAAFCSNSGSSLAM